MVVVAAVDESERASKVVDEATALADAFDLPLHVLHVMSGSEFIELERTSYDDTGKTVPMDEVESIARQFAEDAASDITREFTAVGLMGDADDAIVQYADEQDARYIVVGPRKRSPAGKAIFGSVAQSVLLNSTCPVVTTQAGD
jgi:nucleotide-binding universal stress UspA family protein